MSFRKRVIGVEWHEEERLWIPFNLGYMLTLKETDELIFELQKYKQHTQMIKEHNMEMDKEIEECHRECSKIMGTPKEYKQQPGYVYIVKFKEYFKIGRTKNIKRRIGEYTRLPEKPVVVMCKKVPDCIATELALHELFSEKNARGEWFNLTSEDIIKATDLINDMLSK